MSNSGISGVATTERVMAAASPPSVPAPSSSPGPDATARALGEFGRPSRRVTIRSSARNPFGQAVSGQPFQRPSAGTGIGRSLPPQNSAFLAQSLAQGGASSSSFSTAALRNGIAAYLRHSQMGAPSPAQAGNTQTILPRLASGHSLDLTA